MRGLVVEREEGYGLREEGGGARASAARRGWGAAERPSVGAASLLLGVGSKPWSGGGPGPPSRLVRPGAAALRRRSAPVARPSFPAPRAPPSSLWARFVRGRARLHPPAVVIRNLKRFCVAGSYVTDLSGRGLSPRPIFLSVPVGLALYSLIRAKYDQ